MRTEPKLEQAPPHQRRTWRLGDFLYGHSGLVVSLATAWLILGNLGGSEFRGRITESRRSEAAREIAAGQADWLVPTLGGEPFLTKPPLYYNLAAISMRTFGVNEGAARLPGALSCLIALAAVYLAARLWRGHAVGILSVLMTVTTVAFLKVCRLAEIDSLLLASVAVSLAMIRGAFADSGRKRLWSIGLWLSMAIGFLAKGPHAVMFPLGGLALTAVALRGSPGEDWRLRSMFPITGILLFLAIVLPWFVYAALTVPGTMAVFATETLGRIPGLQAVFPALMPVETSATVPHAEPVWYYIAKLPDLLPWLPIALIGGWTSWHRGNAADRFGLAYILAGIGVLSLISSKKAVYLVPLIPEIAVLGAAVLVEHCRKPRSLPAWYRITGWGVLIIAILVSMVAAAWVGGRVCIQAATLTSLPVLLCVSALGTFFVVEAAASQRAGGDGCRALVFSLLAVMLAIGLLSHYVKPYFDHQRSYKSFAMAMRKRGGLDPRVLSPCSENYAVMFYSGCAVQWQTPLDALGAGDLVLIEDTTRPAFGERFHYTQILGGQALPPQVRHRYSLVRIDEEVSATGQQPHTTLQPLDPEVQ